MLQALSDRWMPNHCAGMGATRVHISSQLCRLYQNRRAGGQAGVTQMITSRGDKQHPNKSQDVCSWFVSRLRYSDLLVRQASRWLSSILTSTIGSINEKTLSFQHLLMAPALDSLPIEIVLLILQYLSIADLLAFSATCQSNQIVAYQVLHTLDLAVFSRSGHAQTAFLDDCHLYSAPDSRSRKDDCSDLSLLYQVAKATQPEPMPSDITKEQPGFAYSEMLAKRISKQNEMALSILSKRSVQNLKTLTLRMYEITLPDLTQHLARNLPRLQVLNLKFFHRTIRDSTTSDKYWLNAPKGTPAWNALAGMGDINSTELKLTGLRELSIERAGLTQAQLQRWIGTNPKLKKLQLINVTGVDCDFVDWLADHTASGSNVLEEVRLESCPQLVMTSSEHWSWLRRIVDCKYLKIVSLWQCGNISLQSVKSLLNAEAASLASLEVFVTPVGSVMRKGLMEKCTREKTKVQSQYSTLQPVIEVDPAYEAAPAYELVPAYSAAPAHQIVPVYELAPACEAQAMVLA